MDYRLLVLPLIGAAIGWLTNFVAIKMLFKPHRPVRIFGFAIQGVLPKRRKAFAEGIAKAIEKELLSSNDISQILEGSAWEEEVEKIVDSVTKRALRIKRYPLVGILSEALQGSVSDYITQEIIDHIEERKPELLNRFHDMVDIRQMVAKKVEGFDIKKLERLVYSLVARELRHIEVVGAVLGFIIGSVQIAVVSFL